MPKGAWNGPHCCGCEEIVLLDALRLWAIAPCCLRKAARTREREREMQVELARHGWTPPATDRISCEAHSSTFGTAPVSRLSWLTNPSKTDGNRQLKQVHSGILWVTQTGLSALHRAGAFHKTQRSVAAHHRICRRCFLETRNSKQPLQPRQKTQSTGLRVALDGFGIPFGKRRAKFTALQNWQDQSPGFRPPGAPCGMDPGTARVVTFAMDGQGQIAISRSS